MWKLNPAPILWTLLTVLLLSACQPIRPDQDTAAQAAKATAAADDQAEPATPNPAPPATLLTLQPPTDGEARSAAELFATISPAVAFVDTPLGNGSAILIQDNYLLTNAHVVWPFTEVRIVFPDGSEHAPAPVAGWDLVADLALVGPVETQTEPLPLVDAGSLPVGSDVYLIGYPAEEEEFPQPSITTGILSRLRSWDTIGYRFFQVDAAAISGQSGGVMVTNSGDVVGLSTFTFGGFGLAASIADALPRLNTILGHDLGVTVEQRGLPQGEGQTEYEDTLRDSRDLHRYLLQEAAGTEIEISIEGVGRPQLYARPLGTGFWGESSVRGSDQKQATLSLTVESNDPYLIEVQQPSENRNSYLLTSSHPLLAYPDPDDRRVIAAGDAYLGTVDVPDDTDVFELELQAGDRVQIDVDSIGIDPWIVLHYESDSFEETVRDDDSGGGMFGENSRIVYAAPRDGTYILMVKDYSDEMIGSYFVNVTVPTEAAELTEPDLSRRVMRTSYGKLTWYESDRFGFSILEPIEWQPVTGEDCALFVLCYSSGSAFLFVMENPLHELPPQERNRDGIVESVETGMLLQPGAEKLSAEAIFTVQGLEADRLKFSLDGGQMLSTAFVYLDDTAGAVFILLVFTVLGYHDEHEPLAEQFIDSFRVRDAEQLDESAAFYLDEAWRLTSEKKFEEALTAYTRSIELDPGLTKAYRGRASLLRAFGRYEEALLDMDKVLEMDPDNTDLIAARVSIFWNMGRLEDALAEIDRAIEMEDTDPSYFNIRALMLSQNGEFERALADIEKAIELHAGELPSHLQDTRGYVYLRMGELEKALADFEAILDNDHLLTYALLGAAIIHGRMGDNEKAVELIDRAMERLAEYELALEAPDPQLADLLEMAAEFSGEEADSQ